MSKSDERYLQFPLSFMRTAFSNVNDTMNRILHVGLYYCAQRIEFDKERVSRRILYDLYHNKLSSSLRAEIDALQSDGVSFEHDYNGFEDDEFNPVDEVEALNAVFATNWQFYAQAVEHYQMHQAMRFMGITGSTAGLLKVGKQLAQESKPGEPMPMINVNMLFDFRDNDKSEQDIAQLCAYLALRSILGTKSHTRTNKEHITCRMFGYASIKSVPGYERIKDIKVCATSPRILLIAGEFPTYQRQYIAKYGKRYHIDKTLDRLRQNWGIEIYAKQTRGLYISAGKVSLKELALIAERSKQKRKKKALQSKTNEAQKWALEQLKKERPP